MALTLGQRVAISRLLSVKYPQHINLDGGTCMGTDHNKLDIGSRRVELLFVVSSRPLCEDCYADAYKQAQQFVKLVKVGIEDVLAA